MKQLTIAIASLALAIPSGVLASSAPQAWGGEGCADTAQLRSIVDTALHAAPGGTALGEGRGSGAVGYSAAVIHDSCGTFNYAVGDRHLERRRSMEVATRHHVGSLSKPVTTALTLLLAEQGLFGPAGLESTVSEHLTKAESNQLKKGVAAGEPLCPARIAGLDRASGQFKKVRAGCPRFNKITLRHLLNGNHGLWDFINEVDRNNNGFTDLTDYLLPGLVEALGADPLAPPSEIEDAFSFLSATGILKNNKARIGGTRPRDFEASFGNTGFQLLGVLLERLAGESYNQLAQRLIVRPLGIGKLEILTSRPKGLGKKIASSYALTSGAEAADLEGGAGLDESVFGLYPLVQVNGHPAINAFDFEPFLLTNGGGGAGAVVTSPSSYARFFHTLIRGGLLGADSQALLDGSFVPVQGTLFAHGFGMFEVPSIGLGTLVTKGGATPASNCFVVHSRETTGGNGVTAVVCRNSADLFLPNEPVGLGATAVPVDAVATDLLVAARAP